MQITRRMLFAAVALLPALPALGHHGWRWTADGKIELTGVITDAQLGNPHGVLTVDAEGEIWRVEVGQPWRNARVGLEDSMLAPGVEIVAIGPRSADPSENLLKAERVVIAGQNYDLYPDRL
ncbi:DUF6152 family protein [Pararhodobacter sp. SW119]|uniref:DUF6152 family protein n=1 Tax=Pararhodobacter sp. SW119 TaxID=2780075 RepID=UPI001ADEEEE5|nr:DUF6152 family protein [Pararhodobacter sp. SW119]